MGLNQIPSNCGFSNWRKHEISCYQEIRSNGLFFGRMVFGRMDLFSVEWSSVEWASVEWSSVEWAVTWLNGVGLTLKRTGWPVYLVQCKVYT